MPVIENAEPSFTAFTSLAYATDGGKAIVITRLPTNLFDFGATNANIAVRGTLRVKLDDGTRRRLTISKPNRALQAAAADAGDEAAFDLNIELQPDAYTGITLEEEAGAMVNSAMADAVKGAAIFATLVASVYVWW